MQSNKYQLIRERELKNAIRKLYMIVPNYTPNKAYAFLIMFIETNKAGCDIFISVQNKSPYHTNSS